MGCSSGSSSTGGTSGSTGGSTGSTGTAGPCGLVGEPEPNNDRDHATPYVLASSVTACVNTDTDDDYYSFTAPADASGGYLTFAFTDVGDGELDLHFYSATDNGEVFHTYTGSSGQNATVQFAVASGKPYRLDVKSFGSAGAFKYTMKATYTKVNDTYEPNDTRDAAKPIALGAAGINAFVFTGAVNAGVTDEEFEDWYSVALTASPVTMTVSNVPTDVILRAELFDASGSSVGYAYASSLGANVTLSLSATEVTTAGTYKVKVGLFSSQPHSQTDDGTTPDHFTRPYKLVITQP